MTAEEALAETPIVAILRGVRPVEAAAHAEALAAEGVRIVEVPLNSPDPIDSIRVLTDAFGDDLVCGGGTILSVAALEQVAAAGGRVAVSPNTDPAVIARAVELGLDPMPGFGSATEAFLAYGSGARRLKLFPASTYGAAHVKALKAVLPADASILAVGGVGPSVMSEWRAAGASAFGLGSELYKPGQSPADTRVKARAAVAAARASM